MALINYVLIIYKNVYYFPTSCLVRLEKQNRNKTNYKKRAVTCAKVTGNEETGNAKLH